MSVSSAPLQRSQTLFNPAKHEKASQTPRTPRRRMSQPTHSQSSQASSFLQAFSQTSQGDPQRPTARRRRRLEDDDEGEGEGGCPPSPQRRQRVDAGSQASAAAPAAPSQSKQRRRSPSQSKQRRRSPSPTQPGQRRSQPKQRRRRGCSSAAEPRQLPHRRPRGSGRGGRGGAGAAVPAVCDRRPEDHPGVAAQHRRGPQVPLPAAPGVGRAQSGEPPPPFPILFDNKPRARSAADPLPRDRPHDGRGAQVPHHHPKRLHQPLHAPPRGLHVGVHGPVRGRERPRAHRQGALLLLPPHVRH